MPGFFPHIVAIMCACVLEVKTVAPFSFLFSQLNVLRERGKKRRFEFLTRYGRDEADNDLLTRVSHGLSQPPWRFSNISICLTWTLEQSMCIWIWMLFDAHKIIVERTKSSRFLSVLKTKKCRPYADFSGVVSLYGAALFDHLFVFILSAGRKI